MELIKLSNISKTYQIDNGKVVTVLNNVTLTFPNNGLVAIVGKSGSGKSTLLNMISLLDRPTSGIVSYKGEDINRLNRKKKNRYRNKEIGIVFQNYNLLENITAIWNTMMPLLIAGKNQKEARNAAKDLLISFGIDETKHDRLCKDLSGGEKERVAIARAIINNPKVLLCDEPTGALDSVNSKSVMETLKTISQYRLVIMVSHDINLVRNYADRIVTISDGEIKGVQMVNDIYASNQEEEKESVIKEKQYIEKLSTSNFKRRFKRNIVSIVSLSIGLVSSMLIMGFSCGSKESIKRSSYKQFDYGVATISKETSQTIPGSKMALVQMSRPSENEISSLEEQLSEFEIEPNFDALIPSFPYIKVGDSILDNFSYNPIYSYLNTYADRNLLLEGNYPNQDSLFEVLINKTAYEYFIKKTNYNPINLQLDVSNTFEYHFYTGIDVNPVITDFFIFQKTVRIVGVVDDFNFLTSPKIYYPFLSMKRFLQSSLLNNLSTYLGYSVNWYDRVLTCGDEESLSSYSYRLFYRNINDLNDFEKMIDGVTNPYKVTANSLTISQTLFDLVNAATIGMEVFLAIAVLGTALILGIISFASYSEDKKTSAILTCLGVDKSDIFSIYFNENFLLSVIALIISFLLSPILSIFINKAIMSFTSFENMIDIPILVFMGKQFLFPLIVVIGTLLICIISTYIPLFFSKKISPKEELTEE